MVLVRERAGGGEGKCMGAEVDADMGPVFLEKGFPVLGWLGN